MPKIELYVWICLNDDQSCPRCKSKDGTEWTSKKAIKFKPPLASCSSLEGCRCEIVPVYEGEGTVTLE